MNIEVFFGEETIFKNSNEPKPPPPTESNVSNFGLFDLKAVNFVYNFKSSSL